MNYNTERYQAVVESGSCSEDYSQWEERRVCGHAHKTYEAAARCLERHINAHYDQTGSYVCNADWRCNGHVHNQHGERA
jgi:hypothetical protein